MANKKRIVEAAWNEAVNFFWWRSMKSKAKAIAVNLKEGRRIEELAMYNMVTYYEGSNSDGKSSVKIVDYENDAVIQSCKIDFIAGPSFWHTIENRYTYQEKMMISVKKLSDKPNGYVWKDLDSIYISKAIWENSNDLSSHMVVCNDNECYLIDTNRFKRYPELLSRTTRKTAVKIKLNRHIEDGDILDLINTKYIK